MYDTLLRLRVRTPRRLFLPRSRKTFLSYVSSVFRHFVMLNMSLEFLYN